MFAIDRRTLVLALATLLALPFAPAAPARAASERYVAITSVPYTITTPGCYRLIANLTASAAYGGGITINCDNVVVDLDGFTIVNGLQPSYAGPTAAVMASNRSNITVRNGTVRGFYEGVHLGAANQSLYGLVVEDMTVIGCWKAGVNVEGANAGIVRRCTVVATQSSSSSVDALAGIVVSGIGAWVHDNAVFKTVGATSFAIHVAGSPRAVVERNKIANDGYIYGASSGINAGGENIVVADNRITSMNVGITYGTTGTGAYRGNITVGCYTPFVGGTDAGNNY